MAKLALTMRGQKKPRKSKIEMYSNSLYGSHTDKITFELAFPLCGRYESWEAVWVDGMWDSGGPGFALPCKLCLAASTWGAQTGPVGSLGWGGVGNASRLRNSASSGPRGHLATGGSPGWFPRTQRRGHSEFGRGRMYQSQLKTREQRHSIKQEMEGRGPDGSQAAWGLFPERLVWVSLFLLQVLPGAENCVP